MAWMQGFALVGLTLLLGGACFGQSGPADGPTSGGLIGYISMSMPPPPDEYRYGVSFYVSAWALLEEPIAGFQIGLPSTWIIPDNRDFTQPLCPPGTIARDHWPERGPTYRDVFQTIEGGLGFWESTRFGSATPKYRINGTPDGYNHEISSPGWGFGQTRGLDSEFMGIAQISNRLLVPPDGLTFMPGTHGEILGNAWMALPLPGWSQGNSEAGAQPTGQQSWTLFLNSANFSGPVVYWIPQTWSRLSQSYATIAGRGLDARPALMMGGAMEVNTVPYFRGVDAAGTLYTRIPKLQFPVDSQGRTFLMQDIEMYSKEAVFPRLSHGPLPKGTFNMKESWEPRLKANPFSLSQGDKKTKIAGVDGFLRTAVFSEGGHDAFGLQWTGEDPGHFPEYFKSADGEMVPVVAGQVPESTGLLEKHFARPVADTAYRMPTNNSAWTSTNPAAGPFQAKLSDGSTVTYSWYRFVDQPSLQHLHLSVGERNQLQHFIEAIQATWKIGGEYMPPPSRGKLASLDPALIVTPPKGMEVGYVPIVTRQEIAK